MLTRDFKRLALWTGSAVISLYLLISFFAASPYSEGGKLHDLGSVNLDGTKEESQVVPVDGETAPTDDAIKETIDTGDNLPLPDDTASSLDELDNTGLSHQHIYGISTSDNKFFNIDFNSKQAFNPSIIPHPTLDNTFIIVAQQVSEEEPATRYFELFCHAVFRADVLTCLAPAVALPIAPTAGKGCTGKIDYFNLNVGPHDARVFMGHDEGPYIAFGSNSVFTCFGWHILNLQSLTGDYDGTDIGGSLGFRVATELQRPEPWHEFEKNFFLFWDMNGQAYAHHEVVPSRVFAQLEGDGSVGPDLAPLAAESDAACMKKYMPQIAPENESIHQATNSLRVTLCSRADPDCVASDANTFILSIFQWKTFYNFHSVYEPYVMLFHQRAPFELKGISRRPFWIHGREQDKEKDTSDMFYITSISWKDRERGYHGYLDDVLFVGFGIEDRRSGGIDLTARHLLEGFGLCDE